MTTSYSPWSDTQKNILESLTVTTCCLSIIGSFCIIVSYYLWKELRSTSRKLLVYLSIADFVTALGNMLGVVLKEEGTWCVVQSAFTTFSSLSSFFWTISIGVYLYLSISKESQRLAEKSILVLHCVSWILPALIIIIALGFGALGSDDSAATTGGWCWVKSGVSGELYWKMFTGKGWEIAAYVVVPILYLSVKRKIRNELSDAEHIHLVSKRSVEVALDADRKMTLIPIVFILVRSWGTARFLISEITTPAQADIFWLSILQAIGDSSQGAANFILFCLLTKKIRKKFAGIIWSGQSSSRSRKDSVSVNIGNGDDGTTYKKINNNNYNNHKNETNNNNNNNKDSQYQNGHRDLYPPSSTSPSFIIASSQKHESPTTTVIYTSQHQQQHQQQQQEGRLRKGSNRSKQESQPINTIDTDDEDGGYKSQTDLEAQSDMDE